MAVLNVPYVRGLCHSAFKNTLLVPIFWLLTGVGTADGSHTQNWTVAKKAGKVPVFLTEANM